MIYAWLPTAGSPRTTPSAMLLVPAEVEDRGRSASPMPQLGEHAGPREDGVGGLEEQGSGVPVHAVGDKPFDLAPARAAAVYVARRVPYLALQVEAVQVALAVGPAVPEGAGRRGEQRRARPDHDRCGGLRERARPGDDGDLRRPGHPDGAQRRRQGVGRHHEQAGGCKAEGVVRGVPEAPGSTAQNTVAKKGQAVRITA